MALEEGKELAPEEAEELAQLEPGVEQRKNKEKARKATNYRAGKAEADRVAELQRRRQVALEEGKELAPEEAEELAQLEPRVEQRKQQHRDAVSSSSRAKKDADAAVFAELKELEEQGRLSSEQQAELNLRREIEKGEKEVNSLAKRVSKLKGEAAEIKALEALPQSAGVADRLRTLRDKVAGLADFAEQLKEAQRSLAEKKKKLKLMQEAGSAPTAQAAQDARATGAKQRQKERDAEPYRAKKAAIDRVAELEGREELTGEELPGEEAEELAELQPRVEKRKEQTKKIDQKSRETRKDAVDLVAEVKGRGQLTKEEKEALAKLESKVEKRKEQKKRDNANKRAGKAAAADEIAKLEELEEQERLTSEQQAELDLRREIEKEKKEENMLNKRVSREGKWSAEIEALEALSRSAAIETKLSTLREKVDRSAGSVEELAKTRRLLAEKKEKLKSMPARGEAGSGRIAEASGQQDEQDAMVPSGVSESAGADRDEQNEGDEQSDGSVDLDAWLDRELADLGVSRDAGSVEQGGADGDAWSDGGVDLGASVDEVMGDSAGEGRAAASLSDLDDDRQAGLEESEEGLVGVEDVGPDVRVARLRESLEQAESDLASLEALPGWDEVVRADFATLPMFDQVMRRDWEEARGRVEALRAELAGMVGDEGVPAGMVGGEGVPVGEWVGVSGLGWAAGVVPDVIARLAELAGRMGRHLSVMPPEFNPNRVRENVETAKRWVRQGEDSGAVADD